MKKKVIDETRKNFVALSKELGELRAQRYKIENALDETGQHIFEVVHELQKKNKNPEIIKHPNESRYYACGYNDETNALSIDYDDYYDDEYHSFEIPIEIIVSDEAITEWFNGLVNDWKEKNKARIEANKKKAEEKRLAKRKALYEELKKEFENQ